MNNGELAAALKKRAQYLHQQSGYDHEECRLMREAACRLAGQSNSRLAYWLIAFSTSHWDEFGALEVARGDDKLAHALMELIENCRTLFNENDGTPPPIGRPEDEVHE